MLTVIPFSGFYNSIWSGAIDSAQECDAEYQAEQYPALDASDINEVLSDHTRYRAAYRKLAEAYADKFNDWLAKHLEVTLTMSFESMTSPKEYNFTTDRIYMEVSREDIAKVYRKVGRAALRAKAKEMFTSRDGFHSFYSPDIEDWGSVRDWDHNQLLCLMEAAVEGTEYEMDIYYRLDNKVGEVWSECVDWPAVEAKLEEMQSEWEAEEAETNPNGFVFPSSTKNYVEVFCKLNNLKV